MTANKKASDRIDIVDLANKADGLLNEVSGAVKSSRTRAIKDSLHLVEALLSDVASALYLMQKDEEKSVDQAVDPADLAGHGGRA